MERGGVLLHLPLFYFRNKRTLTNGRTGNYSTSKVEEIKLQINLTKLPRQWIVSGAEQCHRQYPEQFLTTPEPHSAWQL